MSLVYNQLLKMTVEKSAEGLDLIRELLGGHTPSSAHAVFRQALPVVLRIRTYSGFFGIQKVTDLAFWLENYFGSSEHASGLDAEIKRLLEDVLDAMEAILDSVEEPSAYGEFVKPTGIVMRPLFARDVDTAALWDRLRLLFPMPVSYRHIYRLPVAFGEAASYTLKVPSRFIEENLGFTGYLSVVYLDLGRQKDLPWEKLGEDIMEWTEQKMILYQGALEMPFEKVVKKSSLVPYFILLKSHQHPQDFCATLGLNAHIMKIVKEPGADHLPPLEIQDAEEAESVSQTEGLKIDFSRNKKPVFSSAVEPPPSHKPPAAAFSAHESPSHAASASEEDFGEAPALWVHPLERDFPEAHDYPQRYYDDLARDLGMAPEPASPEARSDSPSAITIAAQSQLPQPRREPLENKEPLAVIPFTLSDLDRPGFNWPQGVDNIDWEALYPKRSSESRKDVAEESFVPDTDQTDLDSSHESAKVLPRSKPGRLILMAIAIATIVGAGAWWYFTLGSGS